MRRMVRLVSIGLAIATGSPAMAAIYTVTNTGDMGMGSLRQAIEDANTNVNVVDRIEFAINGPPFTIQPMSPLPTITDPVTIDGYTQNGTAENTLGHGTNAVLLIEIDGSAAGDTDGLLVEHVTNLGAGTTIRGLIINRFNNNLRAGIRINDDGNNLIEGSFIGTDASGLIARPNFDGIAIELLAAANHIGGTSPAARNLISGNSNRGLVLDTNDNIIKGNLVGTDATGEVGLGNGVGIVLFNFAANNTIGGLGLFSTAVNTISGNRNGGIIIGTNSVGHDLLGNKIGMSANGIFALGNGTGAGVQIGGDSATLTNNQIGGNAVGITINSVTDTVVRGNTIGLRTTGNTGAGILIVDASDNLIGGPIDQANIIAGNGGAGIQIVRTTDPTTGNLMFSNVITDNGGLGIELINGANNGQPAPQLTDASGANHILGTLTAAALTSFRIQFFANVVCDPSGSGEGETLIGDITAATDGAGMASIDSALGASPGKPFITATATDPNNNTSQFSNCVFNPAAIVSPAPALDAAALAAALLVLVAIAARKGVGGRRLRQ